VAGVRGGRDQLEKPMSTTPDTATGACKHCNNAFEEYYAPGYCSESCYHAHQGRKLLNTLTHDHKFCATCGVQLKEVAKPPKTFLVGKTRHAAESIVGFQYRTSDADTGEIDVKQTPGRETVTTGTVCGECGNTSQSEVFPEVRERHLLEYGNQILSSLREQAREGVHDKELDDEAFFDALVEGVGLEVAVGRAIE